VYIVAQKKYPVVTKNGPFLLPHFTYTEIDSLNIAPDVIVIPYMNFPESEDKTAWLRKHYSDSVIILSICDGAWTAAASGIYDGVPMTSHATGHEKLKRKYTKPSWVQNVSFTEKGNLFSTGGVSNATDGSLAVIEKIFGTETMLKVLSRVNYPHAAIKKTHLSNSLDASAKLSVLSKVLFKQNKNVGVLIQNGVSELELAAVFDIYARTMPSSIRGIITNGKTITTKHGLTVLSTGRISPGKIDELHILNHADSIAGQPEQFRNTRIISYDNQSGKYIVDVCLNAISQEYGHSFHRFVKLTLDYN
jgi:transcriptional regulator GlxA family with amidase domain